MPYALVNALKPFWGILLINSFSDTFGIILPKGYIPKVPLIARKFKTNIIVKIKKDIFNPKKDLRYLFSLFRIKEMTLNKKNE